MNKDKFIGLDVHKEQHAVAIAEGGRNGEVRSYGTISSDFHAVEKLRTKLKADGSTLHFVYEAGPTGFALYRRLRELGEDCIVVVPTAANQGKRKAKTDRRDAETLARLHRSGELKAIYVPDQTDEAVRDLGRARTDASRRVTEIKQRIKALLLRQGYKYSGNANWSEKHQRYLRALVLPIKALQFVLEELIREFDDALKRLERYDAMLETLVLEWKLYPVVRALMCCRGVQLVAATVIVSELGDIRRFAHPKHLMAYLGLVPLELTTGEHRKLGSITKAGNAHVRWMLVEIVQHAFKMPKISPRLMDRQKGQADRYKELSWKIQVRLFKRSRALLERGVMKAKIQVALAREMAGFVWAMMMEVPQAK